MGHVGAAPDDVLKHSENFQNGSGTEQCWDADATEFAEQPGPPAGQSMTPMGLPVTTTWTYWSIKSGWQRPDL